MAKFINKIIFSVVCFTFFLFLAFKNCVLNGFCEALPSYILNQNSLSVVQGELGPIEEYGLSSGHVNLFTLPVFITEKLNPYLYQTHGWDLDDVADLALYPLDPTTSTSQEGIKLWSTFDESLNNAQSIGSAVENGLRVLEMKTIQAGQLSSLLGQNAKAFCLGKINEAAAGAAAFVSDVKQNILVKLGDNFSDVWSDNYDGLVDDGDIFENSSGYVFSNQITGSYNNNDILQGSVTFNNNIFLYCPELLPTNQANGFHYIFMVFPASLYNSLSVTSGYVIGTSGTRYNLDSSLIYTSAYDTEFFYDNVRYLSKPLTVYYTGQYSGWTTISNANYFGSLDQIKNYISQYGFPSDKASSVNYINHTVEGTAFNLQNLLSQLDGKYVSSEQLGGIKTILDNNAIVDTQADGAGQIFTDDSLQELIDAINGIINQQDDFQDVLPDPDPEPAPDPSPDYVWPEPPDYVPEWIIGPIPSLLPEEMFSMFKPVFDIVGTDYSMHSTFIAIPAILIIAFVVYFIVSVL